MKQLRCVYICFGTALRRLRSSKGFWISLLLIPVLMAVSLLLFSTPESSPAAGIAFDSDSPSKEALSFASLLEEDGFVLMEKADLREAVAGGEVDCGFLIPASFPEGGSSPAEEGSILLFVSQRTSLDAFFREKIAARLLSLLPRLWRQGSRNTTDSQEERMSSGNVFPTDIKTGNFFPSPLNP